MFAADEEQIAMVERQMAEHGYLAGEKMAAAFNLMRSNDLIWPYVINNYLKGKAPLPFDMLYWNADATRMPAANHSFYLRACYLENRLTRGHDDDRQPADSISRTSSVPIYNLATREDHIAPARSVYLGSSFFGGTGAVRAGGLRPHGGRRQSSRQEEISVLDRRRAAAATISTAGWRTRQSIAGSWWPDWLTWLKGHDGAEVDARTPGDGELQPIEDAPGRYVNVQS